MTLWMHFTEEQQQVEILLWNYLSHLLSEVLLTHEIFLVFVSYIQFLKINFIFWHCFDGLISKCSAKIFHLPCLEMNFANQNYFLHRVNIEDHQNA